MGRPLLAWTVTGTSRGVADVEQQARQRRRRVVVSVLLVVALGSWIWGTAWWRAAGWALVSDERVDHADVIVVATAAGGAGVLEAADLYHDGVAPRVAVFADPPGSTDREFLRRGVPYEDEAARSTRQLKSLGVPQVEAIGDQPAAGTEAEGQILPKWCDDNRFQLVVMVTTRDHSRRLSRVLRRTMGGHQTRVAVRAARFSRFDPDRWWEDRGNVRIAVVELQKLLLDVVRHPFS